MLSRPIRALGHIGAVVLLSGLALLATGTAGNASSAPAKPDTYGGEAAAASMEFRVDKSPLPVPAVTDPFHVWVPYADTSIDSSGTAEGTAASVFPGQDLIGVPDLFCEFSSSVPGGDCNNMPGGGPPHYPDYAYAQYPAHPNEKAQLSQKPFPGTGPFEVTPNNVTAQADPDKVGATAFASTAGLSNVVTAQSASATTQQHFQGGALVVTAESVLKGVDIGGKLQIQQITSTATATIDGSKVGVSSAKTTLTGATVAGNAVSIDSKGIHVVGHGDNGVVGRTINQALKSLASQGIDVRSLADNKAADPCKVAAETGGLLVTATHDVNGPNLPGVGGAANGTYIVTATLGGAGVNAYAAPGTPLPSLPSLTT